MRIHHTEKKIEVVSLIVKLNSASFEGQQPYMSRRDMYTLFTLRESIDDDEKKIWTEKKNHNLFFSSIKRKKGGGHPVGFQSPNPARYRPESGVNVIYFFLFIYLSVNLSILQNDQENSKISHSEAK